MKKIFKIISTFIVIIILYIIFLLTPYFFSWSSKGELIYSINIPQKNYNYELYFYDKENATLSTYYLLQKTYNIFGYYKNIKRLKGYKYFKSMKLSSSDTIHIVLSKYGSMSWDSIYVRIETK